MVATLEEASVPDLASALNSVSFVHQGGRRGPVIGSHLVALC